MLTAESPKQVACKRANPRAAVAVVREDASSQSAGAAASFRG